MSVLGKRMNSSDNTAISMKKTKRSTKSPRVATSDLSDTSFNKQILSLVHSYLSDLGLESVAKLLHDTTACHPGSAVFTKLDRILHDETITRENAVGPIEQIIDDLRLPMDSDQAIRGILRKHELSLLYSSPLKQIEFLRSQQPSPSLALSLLFDRSCIMEKSQLIELVTLTIPNSIVPSKHRLVDLIKQAVSYQESRCVFHTSIDEVCLFEDHYCPRLPLKMVESVRLQGHRDEVWLVSVSHDGNFLVSASKDKTLCVWSTSRLVVPLAVLSGHTGSVGCVAWAPSDKYILSGSADKTLKLWHENECIRTFSRHTESVAGLAWLNDDNFFSGSCDKSVILWTIQGVQLATWRFQGRVQDVAVCTPNWLVVASSERNVQLIDLTGEDKWYDEPLCLPERFPVTSLAAAALSPHVLVNVSKVPPSIHLWNLNTRRMEQRYVGHQQGRFIVRSSFGGTKEQFVLCGSEDGHIFVWSRIYGALLQQFSGHTSVVNAVVSYGANKLVSASDDRTVRIWTNSQP